MPRRRDRLRRPVAVVTALLAAGALLAGCGGAVSGRALASYGDVDPGTVAGLPVTEGPSGVRADVPPADLDVRNGAHSQADVLAVDSLADIYDYWNATLPRAFGQRFAEPAELVSFDSRHGGVRVCGHDSKGVVNAMFCPGDDSVNWDRGRLLPMLIDKFGSLSVLTVLAHEMGHAVQFQLGAKSGVAPDTPGIVLEQQADCYAGGFMRWVAEGHASHFRLSTGRGLNTVLAAVFLVGDRAGTHSQYDKRAHGNAFDRVYAFQAGFAGGPKRCARMDMASIGKRITEKAPKRAAVAQNGGNMPVDAMTLGMLRYSLNQAFHQDPTTAPRIRPGNGRCAHGSGTPPASYCPGTNSVVIDEAALRRIAKAPGHASLSAGNPNTAGGIGDFAAFAEIASRYAMGVQHELGVPVDDTNAGLRTACLTGAWAAATRHFMGSRRPQLLLAVPSGDLDEALAELLTARSVISADVHGRTVPSGFARVTAFRTGYLQGSAACSTRWP